MSASLSAAWLTTFYSDDTIGNLMSYPIFPEKILNFIRFLFIIFRIKNSTALNL